MQIYREQFGYESTYNERYYTTEIDGKKFTDEQIRKATQLEREIEEKKKNKGTDYNENSEEKMDRYREILDKSANNFYKIRKDEIISFEEIEKRHLTFTKDDKQKSAPIVHKEITKDEMIKKASRNSIDEWDIDGVVGEQNNKYEIQEAVSEGSDADASSKSGMRLKSRSFMPKPPAHKGSNKSIDEFEITNQDKYSIVPPGGSQNDAGKFEFIICLEKKKLKPALKSIGKVFVPSVKKYQPNVNVAVNKTVIPVAKFVYNPPVAQPQMILQPPPFQPQNNMGTNGFQSQSQSGFQQWQHQDLKQQNMNNMNSMNLQKKDLQKFRYYRLDRLVKTEDLFSFE